MKQPHRTNPFNLLLLPAAPLGTHKILSLILTLLPRFRRVVQSLWNKAARKANCTEKCSYTSTQVHKYTRSSAPRATWLVVSRYALTQKPHMAKSTSPGCSRKPTRRRRGDGSCRTQLAHKGLRKDKVMSMKAEAWRITKRCTKNTGRRTTRKPTRHVVLS